MKKIHHSFTKISKADSAEFTKIRSWEAGIIVKNIVKLSYCQVNMDIISYPCCKMVYHFHNKGNKFIILLTFILNHNTFKVQGFCSGDQRKFSVDSVRFLILTHKLHT